jgi:dTDP-4-dehydrorhamnose reductase
MRQASEVEILVLGGTGMLGHKIFQHFRQQFSATYCTIRGSLDDPALREVDLFDAGHVFERCDAADFGALERLLLEHKPRVVINCVGIIKQRPTSKLAVPSILLNALLPHWLCQCCRRWGGRLIHFSTDCVFSGKRGGYREDDFADAHDLYGRSKFLGEVASENSLTLRTSIIGRELLHFRSLLEWFLSQNHKTVRGYTRAFYSGLTTNRLAVVVADLVATHPRLSGLYQVTSQTISKFDLLCLLRDAYGLDIEIVPDAGVFCDRSMRGEQFAQATGYVRPAWPELVAELAKDETPYEQWRAALKSVV